MKKLIMFAVLAAISLSGYAQDDSGKKKREFSDDLYFSNNEPKKSTKQELPDYLFEQTGYIYCELLGEGKFLSTKLNVRVDFGLDVSYKEKHLRDENGDKITFTSMVDAMNYMGSMGWEFVQAYVVTSGNQNVYHWLLRKRQLIERQ